MEALAAISLVSSIIQFVDLGSKAFASAREIRDSKDGMTEDNKTLTIITNGIRDLSVQLATPSTEPNNEDERALRRLAQESRDLSERILCLIRETVPTNPKSKREVFRTTMKGIQYKSERDALERKLASCRDQLHLQYTRVTRYNAATYNSDSLLTSHSQEMQQRLADLADKNSGVLTALDERTAEMRKGVVVTSLSDEALNQLKSLLAISNATRRRVICRHLVSSLRQSGMHDRIGEVEDAHVDTFRWLLEIPTGEIGKAKEEARVRYLTWLSSGEGTFHVIGKLGSGKSTLMKYICGHPRTRRELVTWSGTWFSLPSPEIAYQ